MANRNARNYLQTEHPHIFSQMYSKVNAIEIVSLSTAGQLYPSSGPWSEIIKENFNTSANGVITFTGPSAIFFYGPSAVFQIDKAAEITFYTYINGLEVSRTTKLVQATQLGSDISVNRMALLPLQTLDTLQIFASSTTNNTTMTIKHNRILLNG